MIRLKGKHQGERAVVVLGGPSLIRVGFDYGSLNRPGVTVVASSKVMSPLTVARGLRPDYYLMIFPNSCRDNALHSFILRSFLAGIDLRGYLKKQWRPVLDRITENFDDFIETWKPHRGPHKRFRWKPESFLTDSPVDVLLRQPDIKIIAERSRLAAEFPGLQLPHETFFFEQSHDLEDFEIERHFSMIEHDDTVLNRASRLSSSASIAIYPILHYLGFSDVYFIDMDLNMLGSVEFSAPFTFKTMLHYRYFYTKTYKVFSSNQTLNKPFYFRPQHDFSETVMLMNYRGMRFTRVIADDKYVAPLDGIRTISLEEFQQSVLG